jgi:Protein of unknown function (DUF3987)
MDGAAIIRLSGAKGGKGGMSQQDDPWPDPDLSLLDDRRGNDLPKFPLDAFNPRWRAFLERAAHGASAAVDHVALPLLTTTSSLIGAARRVQASPAWSEPFTLWTGLVGDSGTSKTPGIDVSRRALANIERSRRPSLEAARIANVERAALAKLAHKKWQADAEKAMKAGNEPPERPREANAPADPFVAPRFYVSDATPARVAPLLQARPRGILVVADELSGLFAAMRRFGARPFWLEAWCGGPYVVERVSRPPVSIPHLLVGITGGFQPDKLARAFAGDQDGLHARLLFGWPAEPEYRALATEGSEIEADFQEALLRLITLECGAPAPAQQPPRLESDEADGDDILTIEKAPRRSLNELMRLLAASTLDGSAEACALEPKTITLSDAAKAEFEAFRQRLHIGKATLDGLEREWASKGPGNVLRLAGTLTFMAWAMPEPAVYTATDGFGAILQAAAAAKEPSEIDADTMRAAVRLWEDYFLPHAKACLRQVGLSDRHRDARRALRWMRATNNRQVSREDLRRDGLGRRLDAEETQAVIDQLVKASWLRPAPTAETGGRPARRWSVNPKLFDAAPQPAGDPFDLCALCALSAGV